MNRTRTPPLFVAAVIFLCLAPSLLNLCGINFASSRPDFESLPLADIRGQRLINSLLEVLSSNFTDVILQWTSICAAIFTAVLAFVHFGLKRDVTTPIIGVALLTAASMDVISTLVMIQFIEFSGEPTKLLPLTWTISRFFTALILFVGLGTFVLNPGSRRRTNFLSVLITSGVFAAIGSTLILHFAGSFYLPNMIYPDHIVKRPFDLLPLILFSLAAIFVIRPLHRRTPTYFSHALLLSMVPHIAAQLHMTFGSAALHDNSFNIAYFLKIISDVIPFVGLTMEFVRTFREKEQATDELRQTQLHLVQQTRELAEANCALTAEVAERKVLEKALVQSEDRLRTIVSNVPIIIFALDANGIFILSEGKGLDALGRTPGQVVGQSIFDVYANNEQVSINIRKALAGNAFSSIVQIEGVYFESRYFPVRDAQNSVIGVIGVSFDISERLKAEAALEQQRHFLRQIIDINPNFIFAKDRGGHFTLVNQAVAEAYGTTVEDLIGKTDADFNPNREEVEHFRRDDLEVMDSQREKFIPEEQITDASGQIRWLQTVKRPLIEASGIANQILGVATDITARKRTEEALRDRVRFETLITSLSTSFINLEWHEIDQGILNALQAIGEFSGVDRSFIFLLSESKDKATMTHEWHLRGSNSFAPHLRELSVKTFPWWMERLRHLESIHLPRLADLPEHAAAERELLKEHGIKSCIAVPMVLGKSVIGFLGFAAMQEERSWTKDTISLLRLVGEMFANAVQRKRVEEALRQSEELYRKFFEEDLSGTFITTPDGNLITCNSAFAKIFGFGSANEAMKCNVRSLYANPELRAQLIDSIRAHRLLEFYAIEMRRIDGTPVHVIANAVGIFNDRNELIQIKGFLFDNTERKQIEERLREHAALLHVTQDAIFVLDLDSRITFWNRGAEKLYGYATVDVIGKKCHEFGLDESPPHEGELLQRVLVDGNWHGELIQQTRSGGDLIVDSTWTLIREQNSNPKSILVVNTDITDKKRAQTDLMRASKLESIGILAGGIAHDFNNILTAIIGNLSLAKMESTAQQSVYDKIARAEKASFRAKDLTQQLLTFAKGGAPIKKTTSIKEIILESVEFSLRGANSRCKPNIPGDLWAVDVDVGQMNQVINNLIINAAQAMPRGGTINVSCENYVHDQSAGDELAQLLPGNYVKVSIADSGVGISPENLDKIFDPYFTTKTRGTGLGLATVYSIVRRHQGHIVVDTELGKGTTFTIFLPASPHTLPPPQARRDLTPVAGQGNILLMDDDDSVRETAGMMLQQIGYKVEFASNGSDAISLFRSARKSRVPYDLVIMDLTVPGDLGGKDVIGKFKEIDPGVKAIVSSGYSNDPIMANYASYGFSGVIAKPYELSELSKIVHKVLMPRGQLNA